MNSIKRFFFLFGGLFILLSDFSYGATTSAVTLDTCAQLKGSEAPFILVIPRGKPIMKTIVACANRAELNAASVAGIGALEDPTIAYFNLNSHAYETKQFHGIYELVSLLGNITFNEGKRFLHAHVALGDRKHNVIGGHLTEGIVGVTAEITITPLAHRVQRAFDKDIQLNLIKPKVTAHP